MEMESLLEQELKLCVVLVGKNETRVVQDRLCSPAATTSLKF